MRFRPIPSFPFVTVTSHDVFTSEKERERERGGGEEEGGREKEKPLRE